ncbi:SHUGOSHIN 2-like [Durio zibethinus]|uniref:SHUGOSHIN 2-like n=1 Tax=Durio zibethinus TaxID=66656 RepID=A0A6P5XRY6_DURZI|nr:SHUGOSHIN 2-like [Durio zibethinus]
MGGERMAKRSTFGSMVRKRLSDITNSQSQHKASTQEGKPQNISPAAEDYVNQLIKEKMTLMKLIEERNKIIELSGTELQNLRICLQKLQLQNWNLAQSNSQMLAELNLGRDRVKALQHELVCKDALLKAKNLEKKGKADINCQNTGSHGGEQAGEEECMPKAKAYDDDKPCTRNRRRNARSQSMGPSTTSQRGGDKQKNESKRRCLRRQSARFKSQEREPTENLFEIDDVTFTATQQLDTPMHEDGSSITMEETCNLRAETQILKRSSIGRPLRKAVEKVQSYKEAPVNVKMRRKD